MKFQGRSTTEEGVIKSLRRSIKRWTSSNKRMLPFNAFGSTTKTYSKNSTNLSFGRILIRRNLSQKSHLK